MYNPPSIQIGGKQTKALYQFTLLSPDPDELYPEAKKMAAAMAILSAVINSLGNYHPELLEIQTMDKFTLAVAKILSKVRTIAAFSYRKSLGLPFMANRDLRKAAILALPEVSRLSRPRKKVVSDGGSMGTPSARARCMVRHRESEGASVAEAPLASRDRRLAIWS